MRTKQENFAHLSIFFITFSHYWIEVAELSPKCYVPLIHYFVYLYFVTMCKIDPVIMFFSLDEIYKRFFLTFNTTCTAMKLLHKGRGPEDHLHFIMSEMTNKSFIQVMYLVEYMICIWSETLTILLFSALCRKKLLHVVSVMRFSICTVHLSCTIMMLL